MSDDVPTDTAPHIVKYHLWSLLSFVECTRGCIFFDVGIVISTGNVQGVDVVRQNTGGYEYEYLHHTT